jgi:hypothetical protein
MRSLLVATLLVISTCSAVAAETRSDENRLSPLVAVNLAAPPRQETEVRVTMLGAVGRGAAAAVVVADARHGVGDTALFARISAEHGIALIDRGGDYGSDNYSGSAVAAKLGVQRWLHLEHFALAGTLWGSFAPVGFATGLGFASRPDAFDDLLGLMDPYAAYEGGAAGAAVDMALGDERAFVQLQVGTALVDDSRHGIVVDDALIAFAVGFRATPCIQAALEYRLIQEPTGVIESGALHQHLAVSIGNPRRARFRAGVGAGLVLGFDLARQF